MPIVQPLVVSEVTSSLGSPFAQMCQSVHLLSHVIQHRCDRTSPGDLKNDQAFHIAHTLQSFSHTLQKELESWLLNFDFAIEVGFADPMTVTALALSYSAELLLYDKYSCSGNIVQRDESLLAGRLKMQSIAIQGMRRVSDLTYCLICYLEKAMQKQDLFALSPFVMDCIFQAGATFAWFYSENKDDNMLKRFHSSLSILGSVSETWHVASEDMGQTQGMCSCANRYARSVLRNPSVSANVEKQSTTTDYLSNE